MFAFFFRVPKNIAADVVYENIRLCFPSMLRGATYGKIFAGYIFSKMRINRKILKLVTLIKYRTVYATDVASLCYSWFSRLIDRKTRNYLSTSIQGCYEGPCSHANTFQDQPKQQRCRVRFLALNTFALLRLR